MLGGFFSAIFVQIASDYHSSSYSSSGQYSLWPSSGAIIATGSTVGIAIATGVVVGWLLRLVSYDVKTDLYHDRGFWIIESDCISDVEDINVGAESEEKGDSESSSMQIEIYREEVIRIESSFKNKYV